MNRRHTLIPLLCLLLLIAAGCEQSSIAEQERIKSLETLQASTPSATPSPTHTLTPSPTLSPTATTGPSPTPTSTATPTITPLPTPTPLPPTPTPNPELASFSLCTQVAGDAAGGRFSAQVTGITTTVEPAFERLTLALAVPSDSAPPHASARCLGPAGGPYVLRVDLPAWLHDQAFRTSTITRTLAFSGTAALRGATYQFDPAAVAGAALLIELEQPLPFHLTIEQNPYRLILEVAKTSPLGQTSDMLSTPGNGDAAPDAPIFYLQDGDIWKLADGRAANLTQSPQIETALAVSRDGRQVAFCRAVSGADIGDALAPSELWAMDASGQDQSLLAAPGRACADPAFAPDGRRLAFSVDETGASPARQSIWTVALDGGEPERVTSASDEWSRFGPQWLGADRLVYAAGAEDGRSTLFVLGLADGREQDIGAELMRGSRYRALGRPLAGPGGQQVAVEGLRADAEGADLLVIDPGGATLATVGGVFWARPLAWGGDGTLYYLSTGCASTVAQTYELHARAPSGDDKLIAAGTTLGALGHAAAAGDALAYVVLERAPPGPRGPLDIDRASPSALWLWDLPTGARSKLAEARSAISGLAP